MVNPAPASLPASHTEEFPLPTPIQVLTPTPIARSTTATAPRMKFSREVSAICLLAFAASASPAERWSVGNELVERTVAWSDQTGLRTESLTYKPTGRDLTSYSREHQQVSDEFGFTADGLQLSGAHSFSFKAANISATPNGKQLDVQLASRDGKLDVSVHYVVYNGQPAVRKWISIHNASSAPVYLKGLHFEALAAGPGAPAELTTSAGYGAAPQASFFTGRVSDCCIFIRNSITGEGMAIINEAPGYLKRTEVGMSWTEAFQAMYDTDLFPFGRTVAPGETFESAKSSLVLFRDGHAFEDSHWAVPGYVSRVISRRNGNTAPPWLYNTWEPFERRIDQATITSLAPVAKEMGIDIFTIDDGWQADYGSNTVDATHFEQGMPGIQSVLEGNHLRLGLWVPLAAISTKTSAYMNHPEWLCRDRSGALKFTGTASGQSALMCLGSGYRDAALERLDQLITRYHPAYIKVDLTTVFNAYGEEPGCYAQGHQHHDWAESLTRIYESLQYIGEQLFRRHPEVLVDYTFELWGEKHLIDPALVTVADLDWLSNIEDREASAGGILQARTLLYQRALSIPVEAMLIGNLHAATQPIEERFAVAIGSGPLFLGDLRNLAPADRRWYAEQSAWFQNLRTRARLLDSFFPLGNWRQPTAAAWDGFARLSRDSDGIVVLFKNKSKAEAVEIALPAPPGAAYEARSRMTGATLGRVTEADLTRGWKIPFARDHATEIIELRRVPVSK